jgi:putative ABC transport system permease protein
VNETSRHPTPPARAEALLSRILSHHGAGEAILGDLSEEFAEIARARPSLARLWYCAESFRIAARLGFRGRPKKRSSHGDPSMNSFLRDLKFAVRGLYGAPAYTAIVVATLALGIGANSAVFSMVDALLLRPFPIPDIDRLVMIWETVPKAGDDREEVSPANFLDYRAQSTALDEIVTMESWDVSLTGQGEPERLQGTLVTPGFLAALGVDPLYGRTLEADRDRYGAKTVVISYQLFTRRFGADPKIVGSTLVLDGETYDVVGVARKGFDYPNGADLWAPLWFDAETAALRDRHYLSVIGRLRPGRSTDDARTELDLIARRLEEEHPIEDGGRGIRLQSLSRAVVDIGVPAFLAVWQATTVFVLLIACVNVANLVLARGSDRHKELALQQALGARRFRIVRQLLTENLLLSLLGAGAALPVAWLGIALLRSGIPAHIQRFVVGWHEIDLDFRLIGFTAALSICTTLLFGLVPALRASRANLTDALKEGGRASSESGVRQRGRSALVVGEVALALMLLVASGLSIRGTLRLAEADQGYAPDGLMAFEVALPERKYEDAEKRRDFYRSVLEGVRASSGVLSADWTNILPSGGNNTSRSIDVEGQPIPMASERPSADFRVVTPGYFETMHIPLLAGRAFGSSDRKDGARVAIVSKKFADHMWPGEDPLGRRFRIGDDEAPWLTVVGICGDVLHDWFLRVPQPTFYEPLEQEPRFGMNLTVRTAGEPEAITAAVRAATLRVDPDLPLFNVQSMRERLSDRLVGVKYVATVMAVLGIIALVLSAVGIYGLMAYSVSRRTHEIGVRVALGADETDVLRLTVGQAIRITVIGVGIGLGLALLAGRLMEANLFGIVRLDALTFVTLAAVLSAVSILAGYVPARRALGVDPAVALRSE